MRSQLPNLELDSVFEAKEELALAVKNALADTMTEYGYSINNVLITDLDPDVRVKNAMNEINSSKRYVHSVLFVWSLCTIASPDTFLPLCTV